MSTVAFAYAKTRPINESLDEFRLITTACAAKEIQWGPEPGAGSAWHARPLGQILIVTDGTGSIQNWRSQIEEIRKGDVIWIPPGVKTLARRYAKYRDDAHRDRNSSMAKPRRSPTNSIASDPGSP